MREILFCGKRKDNGKWIEGYLYPSTGRDKGKWLITVVSLDLNTSNTYAIIPDTVGEFTGLFDRYGNGIFEGDIIKSCEYGDIYAVKYFGDDNYPAFDCVPEVSNCECNGLSFLVNVEGCEVIGNIYDNPELLKVGTK